MLRFVARRVLAAVPVLLLVTFGVFLLLSLVPGDPAVQLAGEGATKEQIDTIHSQLHLDRPFIAQYADWLWHVVRFDLGKSISDGQPVAQEVVARLPVTISLVVGSVAVALLVGIPLGLLSGLRPGGSRDAATRSIASFGIAIPGFWLASILVSLFAVKLRWLPSAGYTPFSESPIGWLRHIILPATALGLHASAVMTRQLRASVIEVMESNYIRTAWAVGLSRRSVVMKHILKNAASPAATVFGLSVALLLGGSVVIEQIFSIPGIGSLMIDAILRRDLPVVQGAVLLLAISLLAVNTLIDLAYGWLNPRVRVS